MIGSSHRLDIKPSVKEEIAKKRVKETVENYNLDIDGEIEDIEVGYLPGANAATVPEKDGASLIFDEENFFNSSEAKQQRTTLHELLHVKQFNDTLGEWAYNERGVSEDFAQELDTGYKTVKDLEGEVEMITDRIFSSSLPSPYPYEKANKQSEFKRKGFDIDSELADQIEEAGNEILNQYRDVDYSGTLESIYAESGSFAGIEYDFIYIGPDAEYNGEETIRGYLEMMNDVLEPVKSDDNEMDLEEPGYIDSKTSLDNYLDDAYPDNYLEPENLVESSTSISQDIASS